MSLLLLLFQLLLLLLLLLALLLALLPSLVLLLVLNLTLNSEERQDPVLSCAMYDSVMVQIDNHDICYC